MTTYNSLLKDDCGQYCVNFASSIRRDTIKHCSRREVLRSGTVAAAASVSLAPLAAVLAPTPAAAADIRPVAEWERLFLGAWNSDHVLHLPRSLSNNSRVYYDLAYGIDGNAAMFQATGQTRYLDRALLYVENVIAGARASSSFPRSRFKDRYLGWVCKEAGAYEGQEVVLYEIYMWRYVTRLLRLIRGSATVWANAGYRARFQRILAFTEANIFDKWYARGPNSYVYRSVTHITAHFGYIALDLSRLTSDAGRRARCLAVFNNVNHSLPNRPGRSLRTQLIAHPLVSGGLFWDDDWGVFSRPGGDTAHANGVVSFIVECQELGVEWTRADAAKLIATLNGAIWRSGSLTATFLDGSGGYNGWLNDGWVKLGRYSAALQKRFETYQRARNCQLWGNCALNARLLLSGN